MRSREARERLYHVLALVFAFMWLQTSQVKADEYTCDDCHYDEGWGGFGCSIYKVNARDWCCNEGSADSFCLADGQSQSGEDGWWTYCTGGEQAGRRCECDKYGEGCTELSPLE